MDERLLIEGYAPYYYWDIENCVGLTVIHPQEMDEQDENLAEWQYQEAYQYNNWVDKVRTKLFLENWIPAFELPYTYDKERKALVVIYESLENEYSLACVRTSHYSPRGWEHLDYRQEGFYPPIPLDDLQVDYECLKISGRDTQSLDEYGFVEEYLLLWDRDFDEYYPGLM